MTKDEFIQYIEKLSVSELNELVKALEEKFGVSAAAISMSSGQAMAGGADSETAEEKDAFTVVLKETGPTKIQVIKTLRELTGLGLKEVKDMTDKVPATIKEGVKKADADEMKKKLESAGAVVELK